MFEGGLMKEPRLPLLAKACLNLLGRRYATYGQVAFATYVQKNFAQAGGPNVVTVPHVQR